MSIASGEQRAGQVSNMVSDSILRNALPDRSARTRRVAVLQAHPVSLRELQPLRLQLRATHAVQDPRCAAAAVLRVWSRCGESAALCILWLAAGGVECHIAGANELQGFNMEN